MSFEVFFDSSDLGSLWSKGVSHWIDTNGDSHYGSNTSILATGFFSSFDVSFELKLSFLNDAKAPIFLAGCFKPTGSFFNS